MKSDSIAFYRSVCFEGGFSVSVVAVFNRWELALRVSLLPLVSFLIPSALTAAFVNV